VRDPVLLFFSGGLKDGAEDTRERDGTGDAGMMQDGDDDAAGCGGKPFLCAIELAERVSYNDEHVDVIVRRVRG